MGSPSIYVYDCSNAGMIVKLFNQFAEQHEKEMLASIVFFCYYHGEIIFFL
jgi:regulator-associated protein of mTOR